VAAPASAERAANGAAAASAMNFRRFTWEVRPAGSLRSGCQI
jgi:hypothetical protein